MTKYIRLLLFIGLAWGQSTDSLFLDESFYDNGNTWFEGNYKNGIKLGLSTTYYKNGKEWTKSNYKNNERSGKWIFYNEDGTVYEEKEY